MHHQLVRLSTIALLLVATGGCAAPIDSTEAALGEQFTLSVGETAIISGEDLSIEFIGSGLGQSLSQRSYLHLGWRSQLPHRNY